MAGRKISKKQSAELLRSASKPYTILLDDEPYILTQSALKSQVEPALKRKREWFSRILRFLSFEERTLKIRNTYKEWSYDMMVLIEPDKLHCTCSCATPVQSLCIHVYKFLDYLLWNDSTNYFEKFRPGGIMEIATAHRKYFISKRTGNGMDFTPKKNLGTVYQLAGKLDCNRLPTILNLPTYKDPTHQCQPKLTAIAYMLMGSIWDRYLPFPLPCVGVLNKEGTNIKGFYPYLSQPTAENQFDSFFTTEEKALNQKCFEMYKLVEESPGSILNKEGEERSVSIFLFRLWKGIWPLLAEQEYVFLDSFYGKRYLKEKPRLRDVNRIAIRTDIPKLHFQLIDKGSLYQFYLKVSVNGKNIPCYSSRTPFFISDHDRLYLLGSVRDAAIVKWMEKSRGRIVVFKEHFPDFEKEILSPLWEHYDIVHYKNSSKRQTKNGG